MEGKAMDEKRSSYADVVRREIPVERREDQVVKDDGVSCGGEKSQGLGVTVSNEKREDGVWL